MSGTESLVEILTGEQVARGVDHPPTVSLNYSLHDSIPRTSLTGEGRGWEPLPIFSDLSRDPLLR